MTRSTFSPYLTIGAVVGVLSALLQHASWFVNPLLTAALGGVFGAFGAAAYVVVRDRVAVRPRTP